MKEIWKDIEGYNGLYEVSSTGKVRSWKGNSQEPRPIKQFVNSGYYKISLHNNGISKRCVPIHRLVAETFIVNHKNKPFVNHIDGNKLNNNVANLEWCTHAENHKHASELGLMESGEDRYNSKLTEEHVKEIRKEYKTNSNTSQRKLAKKHNVSQRLIWNVVNNKAWIQIN